MYDFYSELLAVPNASGRGHGCAWVSELSLTPLLTPDFSFLNRVADIPGLKE